jgi:hypothetical protein
MRRHRYACLLIVIGAAFLAHQPMLPKPLDETILEDQ